MVDFHAYASAELKGLVTQNGRWAHLDWDTQTLHVVIDGEFRSDHLGLEASHPLSASARTPDPFRLGHQCSGILLDSVG